MGQDHHVVVYDQAMALFSPTRVTDFSQTKLCLLPFSKATSHSSPAYERVMQGRNDLPLLNGIADGFPYYVTTLLGNSLSRHILY